MRYDRPLAVVCPALHQAAAALDKQRRWAKGWRGPQTLALDFGVVRECIGRAWNRSQPEIDRIAEVVCGEAQSQADDFLPWRALHRLFTATHRA